MEPLKETLCPLALRGRFEGLFICSHCLLDVHNTWWGVVMKNENPTASFQLADFKNFKCHIHTSATWELRRYSQTPVFAPLGMPVLFITKARAIATSRVFKSGCCQACTCEIRNVNTGEL
ncbi:hypothetical protein EVAR_44609_1 [Eumeta japonica]|uniref:Uncharacterized protein n=1 Tax=Eumeta variegata TaxID=151549 RepID=A0A4C1XCR0_EUMVA|nr:hypothetical protein EVAR_44609_1 [Eumeta japonica]